jgi:hypothetical protein
MTATARKYYLKAVRPCRDPFHAYLPGRIARTARGAERWFRTYEAAAEYRRSLEMKGCWDVIDIRD